jgi:hypothetical protein
MLGGADRAGSAWLVSSPCEDMLVSLLTRADAGARISARHPVDMRWGDPSGDNGPRGTSICRDTLGQLVAGRLRLSSCRLLPDAHNHIDTLGILMRAIGGSIRERSHHVDGLRPVGILCKHPPRIHISCRWNS